MIHIPHIQRAYFTADAAANWNHHKRNINKKCTFFLNNTHSIIACSNIRKFGLSTRFNFWARPRALQLGDFLLIRRGTFPVHYHNFFISSQNFFFQRTTNIGFIFSSVPWFLQPESEGAKLTSSGVKYIVHIEIVRVIAILHIIYTLYIWQKHFIE